MREPQGMPGIHWVFGAQERGAQKEPRLPAGAWALFLLSEVRVSLQDRIFHGCNSDESHPQAAA